MPDPQNATGTATPTDAPPPINLEGLRVRTIQQARAELPQPKVTPPWEAEPELPSSSRLGQAYEKAKSWLGEHEQHLSEKYLAPFREGLDRMGSDLQQAGESGHTPAGGQLTGPARALAEGVGGLLKQVPVGKDLKETALMSIAPPELPEARGLAKEVKAAEKTAPNLEGLRVREVSFADKTDRQKYIEGRIHPDDFDAGDKLPTDGGYYLHPDGKIEEAPTHQSVAISHLPEKPTPAEILNPKKAYLEKSKAVRVSYGGNDHLSVEAKTPLTDSQTQQVVDMMRKHGLVVVYDLPGGTGEAKTWTEFLKAAKPAQAPAPNLSGLRTREVKAAPRAKELPSQPRLPDTGTHAAIKTDDGSIYFDDAPEKQRTHIMLAKDLGIPPERVVSGGWLTDGEYEGSARSDAGKWGEQARAQARVAEKRTARSSQSEQAKPDMESAWKSFQAQHPDSGELGSWNVGNAEIRKVSAIPDFAELRNLPEGQKAHAWTVPTAKGPIVYIRGDLTQKGFEKALQHELEHVSKGDYPSFSEEYPQFGKPPEQAPKKSLADRLFDEALAKLGPKQGGHAGGGVASEEELARPGRFVKISKSGIPTDQGKTPDFSLKPGEVGYQVKPDGTWDLKAGQETPTTKTGVQNYTREVFGKKPK